MPSEEVVKRAIKAKADGRNGSLRIESSRGKVRTQQTDSLETVWLSARADGLTGPGSSDHCVTGKFMFSVAKAIIIGSGTVAVATGAYVMEVPLPKPAVAQSESDITPIPSVPIIEASSKPLIYSPIMAPDPCANASSSPGACVVRIPSPPPPADPNAGIITIPAPTATPSAPTAVATAQCASLANPAWTGNGPVSLQDTICSATKTCDSLLKPADATGDEYPMLTAGKRYYVTPRTDGVTLPDGAPPAVVAVPADGPIPTNKNQVFPATCFQ